MQLPPLSIRTFKSHETRGSLVCFVCQSWVSKPREISHPTNINALKSQNITYNVSVIDMKEEGDNFNFPNFFLESNYGQS